MVCDCVMSMIMMMMMRVMCGTAEAADELSFKQGDYVWLHSVVDSDWYYGAVEGVYGRIPKLYVKAE
jgi:hypothetical protein